MKKPSGYNLPSKGCMEGFTSTWFMELSISSSFSPDPRRTPTVLFLERFTKHVSMMSPVPDRPVIVAGLAPIFKKWSRGRFCEREGNTGNNIFFSNKQCRQIEFNWVAAYETGNMRTSLELQNKVIFGWGIIFYENKIYLCCQPSYLRATLCNESCHRIIPKIHPYHNPCCYCEYILKCTCNFHPCNITGVIRGLQAEHNNLIIHMDHGGSWLSIT